MPTLIANATDSARTSGANDLNYSFSLVGREGLTPPDYMRGWMHFDYSSIPSSATILSVSLQLYQYDIPRPYADASFIIRRVTSSWNYTTIKRSTEPTQDSTGLSILLMSASGADGYYTWTFDAYGIARIQAAVSGSETNYGYLVRLANEADNTMHAFYDHTNANPPKLSITYRVNGSQPVIMFY